MSLAPMARLSPGEPAASAPSAKPTPDQKSPTKKIASGNIYIEAAQVDIVTIEGLIARAKALHEEQLRISAKLTPGSSLEELNKLNVTNTRLNQTISNAHVTFRTDFQRELLDRLEKRHLFVVKKNDIQKIGKDITAELGEKVGFSVGWAIDQAISEIENVFETAQACVIDHGRRRNVKDVISQLRNALGKLDESHLKRELVRATEKAFNLAIRFRKTLPKDEIAALYNQIEISEAGEQEEKARTSIMTGGPM
jgi:hypothetical protein